MCLERSERNDKNYELIEYLNDVNREHAEVLVEQNINGKTDTSYIYGAEIKGGFDRISLDRFDGSTGYYLYDARGSVSGITNEEGQDYQSYRYSVTGEITFGAPQYDNSHDGYTGEVYFDCYKLNGQHLWRINLGRNIRAGAHYTQFMVFDLDGDGKAEVVMKTADGTVDGKGKVIGNADADYREAGTFDPSRNQMMKQGRILKGKEYLTVFSGDTGEALHTIDYIPARGNVADWGDAKGNRSDRFLACVAYLDGVHPSVVMCRGYYTRTVLAAFDWNGKELKNRWVFDSNHPGCEQYAGQGNHNLRVGDVDGDGCDEIIYGSCAIDHNGKGLYSTRMGHGDAIHLTHFDPSRKL